MASDTLVREERFNPLLIADRLVVIDGLDVVARRAFIATAIGAIDKAAGVRARSVPLDCSQVESFDDGTLGMLVRIAREGQQRGARVTLVRASKQLHAQMETAGVSHFFNWK